MSSLPKPESAVQSIPNQDAFNNHPEWFQTFLANTNQKARTQAAIMNGLKELAPHILQNLADTERPFSFLSIGAGNGGVELPLVASLLTARDSTDGFEMYCQDPAAEMESQFRKKIADPASPLPPGVLKDYAVVHFEDPDYKPAPADLVIASHVWYYVGNWREQDVAANSLLKFRDTIKPDGIGLLTVQSSASDRTSMRDLYLAGSSEQELVGEDLRDRIEELGIETETGTIVSETDMSSCFYKDGIFHPDEEGKRLLSFILRADWDEIDPGAQGRLINRLSALTAANQGPHLRFIDTALWIKPAAK